ncbi:uncharacterized protein FIBRA_09405 [Fibroporia radiculosa]|uniref:Uncharacterized protein n=1 Tax=Fibroporia radiculosa TaxID=599839 RepID=J7SCD5_9APHY|nr:uncharacterized protein FIBRA_09405 [Fibroporia radiculosa]CCM07081.1 predicted protein [Fibroporia radiculosa]
MYEEVCLLCGRPVTVDGRAYCSDECESLDATSPSLSASSSAYPSPYLHSNKGPGSLADVPALVSSALGRSLNANSTTKSHKSRHSISSSSASSTVWSTFTDDEEDGLVNPSLSASGDDDFADNREWLGGVDPSAKLAGSLGHGLHSRGSGLSYARRPSGTNNRSTITTLNRRTSSVSNPSIGNAGSPRSVPAPPPLSPFEDDFDVPSVSLSSLSSANSRDAPRSHGRKSSTSSEHGNAHESTVTVKSRRNRASLPAYFSLLTASTSSPPSRTQRSPSSLQTLNAIARSFQSSPPTPRVANPVLDPITAYSQAHPKPEGVEATPRGRVRQRNPNARSPSSRRSAARSPPRQYVPSSPPPCAHHRVLVGPQARARLDSIEKVADWVSQSPVVGRGRTLTRRNSSPPKKPLFDTIINSVEADDDLDAVRELLDRSLHPHRMVASEDVFVARGDRERRGRRMVDELDKLPMGPHNSEAPGYGNGRSGLRGRERERGRTLAR